ncbi:MAG: dATP pyrophosphohydrolase [Alphaproteobacteria bacterium]|nr:dATP pyrophosphohydrolase [Alphaproteobacteria bacterium]
MTRNSANGALDIRPVTDRSGLKTFIDLPNRLYRHRNGYVPPLNVERDETLNASKNAYFQHAEGQYWLAFRDGRPVGRISAQVDRLHLERYRDDAGHFGLLDAEDDQAVFDRLLETAETWLKERGMKRVRGPFNLSINEECGLLVNGFDHPAMMLMPFAPDYAATRLDAKGYHRAKDLLAYTLDINETIKIRGERVLKRIGREARINVRPVAMKRYKEELGIVLDIFNDAWADNWGFVPFTDAEMRQIAKGMRPLVRPRLNYIAEIDGEPAAMIICLPNLMEIIDDLDGKLLPIGWAKLLWRLKTHRFKSCRVPLMGIRQRYRGSMIGSALLPLLLKSLHKELVAEGFERVEMSWILDDNMPMRRVLESHGAEAYRTYRLFEKPLD